MEPGESPRGFVLDNFGGTTITHLFDDGVLGPSLDQIKGCLQAIIDREQVAA